MTFIPHELAEWFIVVNVPGGMDGVADGDDIACPAHIQVGSREGDEAGVSHGMLVPTQYKTHRDVEVDRFSVV